MADIIRDIYLYQQRHPELRVGQIIVIAANKGGWKEDDVFYCPDKTIADGLTKLLGENNKNKSIKVLTNREKHDNI